MKNIDLPRSIKGFCLFLTVMPALCAAQGSTVTLYGIVDAAMRRASNLTASGGSDVTMEDGIFTGSRFGVRVREDLGDGLSTVVTMESGFEPGSGRSLQASPTADFGQVAADTRFWGREVNIGLRGGERWGVTLGRQYTLAHLMAARFQPLGNPNNLALSIFSSHHIARQDNVVKLDAKVAGVDLATTRTLGEVADSQGSDAWAVSAGYGTGPLYLGGYVQQMKNVTDTEERKIVGLGGNYKLTPKTSVFAGAMRRTNAVSPQENKVWTVGVNFPVHSAVTVSVAYLHDEQTGSAALEGSRQVGYVAASYAFSRRSDVYVVWDHNDVKDGYAKPAFMGTKGNQNAVSLALRHRF